MKAETSPRMFVAILSPSEDEGGGDDAQTEAFDAVARAAGSDFVIEAVSGHPGVLLLTAQEEAEHLSLTELRVRLLPLALVQPVLIGEDGEPRLPTGMIRVRFEESPSDDLLAEFAVRHHLALKQRNRFIPRQVDFSVVESADDETILDSVATIEHEDGVEKSWADTLQQYRRVGR